MNRRQRSDLQFYLGLCAALVLLAGFVVTIHLTATTSRSSFPPAAVRSLASPSHVVSK